MVIATARPPVRFSSPYMSARHDATGTAMRATSPDFPRGGARNAAKAWGLVLLVAALLIPVGLAPRAADQPDLIFRKSTVFHLATPNDKLATYAIDDPLVDGVACHFTVPERGGLSGFLGVAEEVSDISLACRQIGPIHFKEKFEQGEEMFRRRRSIFFKKMQIVRGCDVKRNVLVYVVYSDKLVEGSPKNSTSTVPIMPWGADAPPKCADWVEK
jgi:CreA protein